MAILSLSNAHLAYGHVALLDGTAFSLESGERLGLIGRNGAGKSSMLKVIAGLEKLDDGLLQLSQGLRISYVPQEPVFEPGHSVFEAVSEGVAEARAVRQAYEEHADGVDLDALQTRIEALDAWTWEWTYPDPTDTWGLRCWRHCRVLQRLDQHRCRVIQRACLWTRRRPFQVGLRRLVHRCEAPVG